MDNRLCEGCQAEPPSLSFGSGDDADQRDLSDCASGSTMTAIFAAVRRRWMAIIAAGLVGGAASGLAAWFVMRPRIHRDRHAPFEPPRGHHPWHGREFGGGGADERVRDLRGNAAGVAQEPLRRLTAALEDDTVKGLPSVRRESNRRNAVAWLASRLRVEWSPEIPPPEGQSERARCSGGSPPSQRGRSRLHARDRRFRADRSPAAP